MICMKVCVVINESPELRGLDQFMTLSTRIIVSKFKAYPLTNEMR